MKLTALIALFFICAQSKAQTLSAIPNANPNFKCRTDYVASLIERLHLNIFSEEMIVGIHAVSTDDAKNYKISMTAQGLFSLINPQLSYEPSQFELLYFSIGKMLHHDTVYLSNTQISKLESNIVDETELALYDSIGMDKVKQRFVADDGCYKKNSAAIYYYFDRNLYPSLDLPDCVMPKLNFKSPGFIVIPIIEKHKIIQCKFDDGGVLIDKTEK